MRKPTLIWGWDNYLTLGEGQHEGQGYTPKWQDSSMVRLKIFVVAVPIVNVLNFKSSSPVWYENLRSVLSCFIFRSCLGWVQNLKLWLMYAILNWPHSLHRSLSWQVLTTLWKICLYFHLNLPLLSLYTCFRCQWHIVLTHIYNISQIMTWFSNINITASHPLHFNDQLTKYFSHQQ